MANPEIVSQPLSPVVGIYRPDHDTQREIPYYAARMQWLEMVNHHSLQILVMSFGELVWINVFSREITPLNITATR